MIDIQRLPQPENLSRVETGVVQFGDDWPGVFIRGDNALTFANMLRQVATLIPANEWLMLAQLNDLAHELQACSVGDTGWPPASLMTVNLDPVLTEARAYRDSWIGRLDARKQELIACGMPVETADATASREVIAELRGQDTKQ